MIPLKFSRIKHLPQVDGQLFRAYKSSAGADICSNAEVIIPPKGDVVVSTGIAIQLPTEPDEYGFTYCIQIWPRSGLSVKQKIETGAGVGDAEYRGEYKIHLYNLGNVPVRLAAGDRVAQILVVPCITSVWEEIQWEDVLETDRGVSGFGSTGV